MSVTEFLLARIAEDEAAATAAVEFDYGVSAWCDDGDPVNAHIARHDPARVLAECQAKRAIIEQADEASGLDAMVDNDRAVGPRDMETDPYVGDVILRHLAGVYADHPDYRQEWKP